MTAEQLLVQVQDERYGVPVQDVVEVLRIGAVTAMPGAPAVVLGLQNLRGQAIPVVDLASLLGLAEPAPRPYGVVVDDAGRLACFAVEAVLGIELLAGSEQDTEGKGPLIGSALSGDALVGLLDVAALLDATITAVT